MTFLSADFSFSASSVLLFGRFDDVGGGRFGGVLGVLFELGDSCFELGVFDFERFDFFEGGLEERFEFDDSFVFGIHRRNSTLLRPLTKDQFQNKMKKYRERVQNIIPFAHC